MPRKKIEELLSSDHRRFSPLKKLLSQAGAQTAWTQELQALLPKEIRRDCRVMNVQGTRVHVTCRNAAAATRLRFLAPELVSQLRALPQYDQVSELKIRVASASEQG